MSVLERRASDRHHRRYQPTNSFIFCQLSAVCLPTGPRGNCGRVVTGVGFLSLGRVPLTNGATMLPMGGSAKVFFRL